MNDPVGSGIPVWFLNR